MTVFIPAFNVERYIREAIESVLAQTFPNLELLIIDDGSTDRTPAIIAEYKTDSRVQIVTHTQNQGRPRTRNHGLDIARGDYIAFLDGDDYCAPHRLARQVAYLDAHPTISGVGSWKAWIDDEGRPSSLGLRRFPLQPADIACEMLATCALGQTSMMVRRLAFADYRYDEAFHVAQDYELWSRMIQTCRFANLSEPLTFYRHHPTQAISANKQEQRDLDLEIYGRQVSQLGVSHDRQDLARHERLFKFASRESVQERTGKPLDLNYIRWAREWLDALCVGNQKERIYPPGRLNDMLAARWLFACRKALRNSSTSSVAAEMGKSELTYWVMKHPLRQYRNRKDAQYH